jgi:hypothetical protein
MKVERDAVLTCESCGVEGIHELLYLSEHLRASRCANCNATLVYSHHIFADYARDVTERSARLPFHLARKALGNPTSVISWPIKAVWKPFEILHEATQVASFERSLQRKGRV